MRKKIITVFLALLFVAVSITNPVGAKAKPAPKKTNVIISPVLAKSNKSVSVYFANLQKVSSIQYELSYLTNGKPEGAGGTINTKKKYSLSRTLLFGTCSAGVCRYHSKLRKATLTVIITFTNGTTVTKKFKLIS